MIDSIYDDSLSLASRKLVRNRKPPPPKFVSKRIVKVNDTRCMHYLVSYMFFTTISVHITVFVYVTYNILIFCVLTFMY